MSCVITATEFKDQFDRGQFDYGASIPQVRDKDINEAIEEAEAVMNEDLYGDDTDTCKKAKLYLTAHFLTLDLGNDENGGQPTFHQNSRSADGISESVQVPEWMLEGEYALYTTTSYGIKFLTLSKPYMGGAIYSVKGATRF
jgi:hypothetical protein